MCDTVYSKIHNGRSPFVIAAWLAFLLIFTLAACFEYADDINFLKRSGGARSGLYFAEDAEDDLDDLDDRICAELGGSSGWGLAYCPWLTDMYAGYLGSSLSVRFSANGGYSGARGFAERHAVKIRDNLDDGDGSDLVLSGVTLEKYGVVRNINSEYSHRNFHPFKQNNDVKADYCLALRRYDAQVGTNPGVLDSSAAFLESRTVYVNAVYDVAAVLDEVVFG